MPTHAFILHTLPIRHPRPYPSHRFLSTATQPSPTPVKPPPSKSSTLPPPSKTASETVSKTTPKTKSTPSIPTLPTLPTSPSTFSTFWPRALILLVAAIWGTNFATIKLVQSGIDAVPLSTAALARFTLASLCLLPPALRERKPSSPNWLIDSVGIGFAVTVGYFAQAVSLQTTTANKSAFMCSLAVVIVPLLERIGHKLNLVGSLPKKSVLETWLPALLAVFGVGFLELHDAQGINQGDAWAFLQAVGFAMGFLGNARAAKKYPGMTMSITMVQLGVVAICSLIWACFEGWHMGNVFPDVMQAFSTTGNATGVIYAGVVTTALTIWLENLALVKVDAAELTVLLSTEPLWAAGFAALTLNEKLGSGGVMGGGLILLACLMSQKESR